MTSMRRTHIHHPALVVALLASRCTQATTAALPRDAATTDVAGATDARVITVTVRHDFAVGWADAPRVAIDGAPFSSLATLYIPAARPLSAHDAGACWRDRRVAVGDRYRLTIAATPRVERAYRLSLAMGDEGRAVRYHDVIGCERLAP